MFGIIAHIGVHAPHQRWHNTCKNGYDHLRNKHQPETCGWHRDKEEQHTQYTQANIEQNYKLIETIKQKSIHDFERYGDDQIIIYTNSTLKVISFKEYKEIKTINIDYQAYAIKVYQEKGIILVGGCKKYERGFEKGILSVYKSDNFELIKAFEGFHDTCVKGVNILKNGLIATFGEDPDNGYPIKIWSLE